VNVPIVSPGRAAAIASPRVLKWFHSIFESSLVYAPISTGYTCRTNDGSLAAARQCLHTPAQRMRSGYGSR
jgi:hypothetical protein